MNQRDFLLFLFYCLFILSEFSFGLRGLHQRKFTRYTLHRWSSSPTSPIPENDGLNIVPSTLSSSSTPPSMQKPSEVAIKVDQSKYPPPEPGSIDAFCRWTNSVFRNLTLEPIRDYLDIIEYKPVNDRFFSTILTPPQVLGVPRPVSTTIYASVPTLLGWYGYYKYSVSQLCRFE